MKSGRNLDCANAKNAGSIAKLETSRQLNFTSIFGKINWKMMRRWQSIVKNRLVQVPRRRWIANPTTSRPPLIAS
jgi:hypothetical protein